MLTPEEMMVKMATIRDQFLAVIGEHEAQAHGGEPCWPNRASALAYFAHTVGARGPVWDDARDYLSWYDANCRDAACPHLVLKDREPPPTELSIPKVREVTEQQLSDYGINPYAVVLMQESYSRRLVREPVTFIFRGTRFMLSMETPDTPVPEEKP